MMTFAATGFRELYALPGFFEPFSAFSHLFGVVLFSLLGVMLLRRGRGSAPRRLALSVYAASCVILFSMSALYHMMPRGGTAHAVMERLDHSAIFVLIAGTFTPALFILFCGRTRASWLVFIWAFAAIGIALKAIFLENIANWVGIALYLTMGWCGVFMVFRLIRRNGFAFVAPLMWGGIAYSIGALLDLLRWPTVIPGVLESHDVFHIFVLIGAVLHFRFIWRITTPALAVKRGEDIPLAFAEIHDKGEFLLGRNQPFPSPKG